MQNLAPGRPGAIRPQVGQALRSPAFPPPAGGPESEPVAGAVGFGGAVGVEGLDTPPALPGTGGLAVGNGGFGGPVGKPVAGTGGLGGGFAAAGTGGFPDAVVLGTGGLGGAVTETGASDRALGGASCATGATGLETGAAGFG